MFRRILAGTDFSLNADIAWRCAVDVARRFDAELRLAHVAMPTSADAPRQIDDEGLAADERSLEERATRAGLGSRVKTMISRGEPAEALAAIARDEGIDLLVVGTHGHRQAAGILVGSVAERLIRLAPCTVMIVVKSPRASADATV
jgi:universal stress protein A